MKRLLTLALCAASLVAAVSCVKDSPKDSTIKAKSYNYFKAVASTASLPADAGIVTLDITANVPWTIKADEGLTPEVTEGSGNASVCIAVVENPSFTGRSFSYSVFTEAELDVDDTEQWTVFGRTLDFSLMQEGALPKFLAEPKEQTLPSSAVSAKMDFSANFGYQIECLTEGLSYDIEDDVQVASLHHIVFHFPVNKTENPVEYKAEIRPEASFASMVNPITVVIRQSALKVLHLDCTDATKFKRMVEEVAQMLPLRGSTVGSDFDFWLEDYPSYIFSGDAYRWSSSQPYLCLASNKSIKLPNITGYTLSELKITAQYSSKTPKYAITDGTTSLASFSMDKAQLPKTLDVSAYPQSNTSPDRYLKVSGEGNIKFILTYLGVE